MISFEKIVIVGIFIDPKVYYFITKKKSHGVRSIINQNAVDNVF